MRFCEICGQPINAKRRDAKTCSAACRLKSHRAKNRIQQQLVLSLFPGADLLGRAFETAGFTVVRGPDMLWGGDIRTFHVPPGVFSGVIGGPPCTPFTRTAFTGTAAENLIPEFLRVVDEAQPHWAVMENVTRAPGPSWPHTVLRDYDCGGLTNRVRAFWFYGIPPAPAPLRRCGHPEHTVLATSWKKRSSAIFYGHESLSADDAARLQGFPDLGQTIMDAQPIFGGRSGLPLLSRRIIAVHLLGNGIPRAMGEYVACHVKQQLLQITISRQ